MEKNNISIKTKERKVIQKQDKGREILKEMIKNLSASCKKRETDYFGLGEDLLGSYQILINGNYYHSDNDLVALKELKRKLEGIKKWEFIDYNKEIASFICQYLIHHEENKRHSKRTW